MQVTQTTLKANSADQKIGAIYDILTVENHESFLRKKAAKVNVIDGLVRQLLDDMTATMYASGGIGLAAPQIGISKRIIVVDLSYTGFVHRMINPVIVSRSEEKIAIMEGCLSVPGKHGEVQRSQKIVVKYQDDKGKFKVMEAAELLAIVLQHEIDHLDGILFTSVADNVKETTDEESPVKV